MSFSEFTIAMALAGTPISADTPPAIGAFHSDILATDLQTEVLPIPQTALATNRHMASALAIATLQSEPPAPLELQPLEPVTITAPPLSTDPASPSPAPEPDQTESNEIIVTARPRPPKSDPLQELNADSFEVIQDVDEAVIGPVALAYEDTLPGPVRSGLSNFLSNLGEPIVFLNYLLQLKPGKAVETLGRFAINSTFGVAGLVDVAKEPPFNLPKRHNGFANTLGYYGVEPGPFLFLPLIGPTTVRDLFGRVADLSVLPFAVGKPFNQLVYTVPAGIITSLDSRAELDDQLRELREANDPYTATRQLYLQQRQAEIDALRGKSSGTVDPVPRLLAPSPLVPESTIAPPSSGISPVTTMPPDTPVVEENSNPAPSDQVRPTEPQP